MVGNDSLFLRCGLKQSVIVRLKRDHARGDGETTVTVVVRQPEVEPKVRIRDLEAWLESNGRSPAEMALKSRLRELLSK